MENNKMINETIGGAVLKSAPTGAVAAASLLGLPLNEWTMIIAIAVGIMQVIHTGISVYLKWNNRSKKWTEE